MRLLLHLFAVVVLTIVTQLGGIAWLIACGFKARLRVFLVAYLVLWGAAIGAAPLFGRVPLHCWQPGPLQMQSWVYCLLNRNYVTPEMADVLRDAAGALDRRAAGTTTLVLDGSFPFFDGFPLLPHLSHDDGEKADLAFFYRDETGYLPGATRSPIGYFAFEPGPTECGDIWPTLRWNLEPLQPLWANYALDEDRLRAVLEILADDPRVGKILLEPHLKTRLSLSSDKIRFQGCRAARHDDHIHLQL
ncbi:MAG: hypothetical protein AAFV38_13245 [Pseudomonadota bacterium]